MADKIKGITVEINGDTTPLSKALAEVNSQSRSLQGELRSVEKLLKFDPTNTELLAQKQKILAEQVESAKIKVNALRQAQEEVKRLFAGGEIDEGQYRKFERELISAEQQLKRLQETATNTGNSGKSGASELSVAGVAAAQVIAQAFLAAIDVIKDLGKQTVESAAEIRAETSQFEQTFDGVTREAEANIKKIADSSGILSTRLNTAASSIYAFAKSSGGTASQSMDIMTKGLQAAADAAAYYDRSLEDTTDSLMSFLKGNFANDAALGVSCTETTRNAAAMELFGQKYNELSEIQKQQTLLKMVTDAQELSGAMGQAAREADGWENVIGNLSEAWRQFLGALGELYLDDVISVVQVITTNLQGLAGVLKEDLCTQLKDVTKTYKDMVEQADEGINSTEAEIIAIQSKSNRYEELLDKEQLTATEEAELKRLAEDLQAVLPETTSVIDSQTGAYQSCATAVKVLTDNLREQAVVQAYSDKITAAAQAAADAQSIIIDANATLEEEFTKRGITSQTERDRILANTQNQVLRDAADARDAAQKQYDQAIADQEQFYADMQAAQDDFNNSVANTISVRQIIMGDASDAAEDTAGDVADVISEYDTQTKSFIDDLDNKLALHQINESMYYDSCKKYLKDYCNTSSKEYWTLYDKTQAYYDKQADAQKKAADTAAKQADSSAKKAASQKEKQQKEDLTNAKKTYDELLDAYKNHTLDKAEYDKEYTALLQQYKDVQVDLTKYASEKMADYEKKQQEAQQKTVKDSLTKIYNEYDKAMQDIDNKVQSYASKIGKSFTDLMSVTKDDNGKITVESKNGITDNTKALEEYYKQIELLQSKNASSALLSELTTMDFDTAVATAKYWNTLSDTQLANLSSNWQKNADMRQKIAEALYADDAKKTAQTYLNKMMEAIEELSPELQKYGANVLQSLFTGVDTSGDAGLESLADLKDILKDYMGLAIDDTYQDAEVIYKSQEAGKAVADNMAEGIRQQSDEFKDALESALKDAIADLGIDTVFNILFSGAGYGNVTTNNNGGNITINQTISGNPTEQSLIAARKESQKTANSLVK